MPDHSVEREFTRVPVHIWGTFHDGERELVTAQVDLLSPRGCHASTFEALPQGAEHALTLFTEDGGHSLRLTLRARVVRSDEDGMGIEFTGVPVECWEHLRRLVLLHAHDPDQVERELDTHLGIKRAS